MESFSHTMGGISYPYYADEASRLLQTLLRDPTTAPTYNNHLLRR